MCILESTSVTVPHVTLLLFPCFFVRKQNCETAFPVVFLIYYFNSFETACHPASRFSSALVSAHLVLTSEVYCLFAKAAFQNLFDAFLCDVHNRFLKHVSFGVNKTIKMEGSKNFFKATVARKKMFKKWYVH